VGSLERNVLPGARKFVELGVQEKKPIEKLETLDPVPRTMIESRSSES
jgi:DNA recombination protein RmuC